MGVRERHIKYRRETRELSVGSSRVDSWKNVRNAEKA